MTEETEEIWFYTHEGERLGPVAFSELQAKAREAGLNQRLDMVWKQGMEEWKAAGEIAGLYEKADAPESQKTLAPTAAMAGEAESPAMQELLNKIPAELREKMPKP